MELTPEEYENNISAIMDMLDIDHSAAEVIFLRHIKTTSVIPAEAKAWLQANPGVKDLLLVPLSESEPIIMAWDLTTVQGRTKLLKGMVFLLEFARFMAYKQGIIE